MAAGHAVYLRNHLYEMLIRILTIVARIVV